MIPVIDGLMAEGNTVAVSATRAEAAQPATAVLTTA